MPMTDEQERAWIETARAAESDWKTWAAQNGIPHDHGGRRMGAIIEAVAPLIRRAALEEAARAAEEADYLEMGDWGAGMKAGCENAADAIRALIDAEPFGEADLPFGRVPQHAMDDGRGPGPANDTEPTDA